MSTQRNALTATVVGGALVLGVMLLHPTGADAVADIRTGGSRHVVALARAVHIVAIGAVPLLLAGMTALSWRLRARVELATSALVCFALAAAAVTMAAAMSGFVAPGILDRLPAEGDPLRDVAFQQLHYTRLLNQAFATVYVGLTAAAFLLWALAMRGDRVFPPLLRWSGVVVGLLPLIGVLVGHLRLEVGDFGVTVLGHTTWMMAAAWCARRPALGDGEQAGAARV